MPRDAVSRTAHVGTVGTNGLNIAGAAARRRRLIFVLLDANIFLYFIINIHTLYYF